MCAGTDVMIGCRESDIVHYREICEKHLHSNYVTTHKINRKSSAYFLSLFLCWCDASRWHIVRCCTFHHGQQKSPKKWRSRRCTSHAWLSVCWSYNAQKLFCIILFLEILVCVFFARFITRELAFSFLLQHGYLKWLKRKWSCQEVTHKGGNWNEC